jgi:hypothetical protein
VDTGFCVERLPVAGSERCPCSKRSLGCAPAKSVAALVCQCCLRVLPVTPDAISAPPSVSSPHRSDMSPVTGDTWQVKSRREDSFGSIASLARPRQVGCFTSRSGHQISRTDLLNDDRRHSAPGTSAGRRRANESAETTTLRRCVVPWRRVACQGRRR